MYGKARNADFEDVLEDDVVEQQGYRRVEKRPEEPEGAVFVLDAQLFPGHSAEQLPILPYGGQPLPQVDLGRDDRQLEAARPLVSHGVAVGAAVVPAKGAFRGLGRWSGPGAG